MNKNKNFRITLNGWKSKIPGAQRFVDRKVNDLFGQLPIKEIRKRLYNNIIPVGYSDAEDRIKSAVKEYTLADKE